MPRFWWAPCKLIILPFDIALLLTLLRIVPPERRAMNVLLGASHLLIFGLGNATLLPPADLLDRYPTADGLIARLTSLPAYRTPDWLLLI